MGFYLNKASKMKLNLRLLSAVPTKVNYAPLAKGPLPPPPLMRNIALNSFKAQSAPYLVMLCGVWAVSFWYFHERPKKKVPKMQRLRVNLLEKKKNKLPNEKICWTSC